MPNRQSVKEKLYSQREWVVLPVFCQYNSNTGRRTLSESSAVWYILSIEVWTGYKAFELIISLEAGGSTAASASSLRSRPYVRPEHLTLKRNGAKNWENNPENFKRKITQIKGIEKREGSVSGRWSYRDIFTRNILIFFFS